MIRTIVNENGNECKYPLNIKNKLLLDNYSNLYVSMHT